MNTTLNETIVQVVNETSTLFGINIPFTGSPALDIFFLALFGSLFVTLINKYLSDQVKIKALREDMKELRKKSREVMMKDPQKAQKIQQEIMKKSFENIKHSMNPKIMIITMIPLILLFGFISRYYSGFGGMLYLGFTTFGWLGTYIVFSIINSIILKKILDVA